MVNAPEFNLNDPFTLDQNLASEKLRLMAADRGQVFPITYLAEDIVELNGYIKKLCEKHGCTYVDVHSCLKQEDNTMDHRCSFDGCHPNDEGYRRISAVLRPYLE